MFGSSQGPTYQGIAYVNWVNVPLRSIVVTVLSLSRWGRGLDDPVGSPGKHVRSRCVTDQTTDVRVSLAEIARIAGVGRAAVSNWRRRHGSFPPPTGGTDASPQFDLAQVRAWLRDAGKATSLEERDLLWPRFEALGDRDSAGRVIAAVGERLASRTQDLRDLGLSPGELVLADEAVAIAARDGARSTFDFLLSRWRDANVRQISSTPEPLAALMVEIANVVRSAPFEEPQVVLDPACGTGGVLAAVASAAPRTIIFGQEKDPVLAALARARLGVSQGGTDEAVTAPADIRAADTMLADTLADVRADVVVCSPPFGVRNWGYEALLTDSRWQFGLPPRTEPELAWVQHSLARLAPGGVGVILLPAGVASRTAGRRIRAALLRGGAIQAVIALPTGSAPPYAIALQLWVVRRPSDCGEASLPPEVLLVDAAVPASADTCGIQMGGKAGIDWARLSERVLQAVRAGTAGAGGHGRERSRPGERWMRVPVIDLLDEQVDLTPARYVTAAGTVDDGRESWPWDRFGTALTVLRESSDGLQAWTSASSNRTGSSSGTVADLIRSKSLALQAGRQLPEGVARGGEVPDGALPVLTIADLLVGGPPSRWVSAGEVAGEQPGDVTVCRDGDVVVSAVSRAFSAWVQEEGPTVLGPQLFLLRPDPSVIDPWFLAGCLRSPSNVRQADTHSSAASRIDVRRLRVLRVPLAEQRRLAEVVHTLTAFERALREVHGAGTELVGRMNDAILDG